jgi:hypothetical protein
MIGWKGQLEPLSEGHKCQRKVVTLISLFFFWLIEEAYKLCLSPKSSLTINGRYVKIISTEMKEGNRDEGEKNPNKTKLLTIRIYSWRL